MNDYTRVTFSLQPCDEDRCDVLSALLAEVGFESFEACDDGLNAYIPSGKHDAALIAEALEQFPFASRVDWRAEVIAGRDWNEEWEKNHFTPIAVAGSCIVHSSFHKDYPWLPYDIVINPKMAFGTGHHETTTLMIERLLDEDLEGQPVLDVGTGTGILAILASMLGASHCTGIEIDEAAYANALENVDMNGRDNITIIHGDASAIESTGSYSYVLANINRNTITTDIPLYTRALNRGGRMLLSGFYSEDIPIVSTAARAQGLKLIDSSLKKNWAMLVFYKG